MGDNDGCIGYKEILKNQGTFFEMENQVQNQECKEPQHGNETGIQYETFPHVSFQQGNQGSLEPTAQTLEPQVLLVNTRL
jgi:hypothetical protein